MSRQPKHAPRRCKIFNFDRRRGNFCCTDCGHQRSGHCKNYCLNGPERCGQVSREPAMTKAKPDGKEDDQT